MCSLFYLKAKIDTRDIIVDYFSKVALKYELIFFRFDFKLGLSLTFLGSAHFHLETCQVRVKEWFFVGFGSCYIRLEQNSKENFK